MTPDSTSNDDDNSPPPYIRLRIDPQTKQEWLEYLDDSHHSTLTDLIKTSVNNTISGKWVLTDDESDSDISEGVSESLDDINERLGALETQLDDVAIGNADPDDELNEQELMRIAHQAHDCLPVVQDSGHLLDVTPEYDVTLEPHERAKITGAAQDISSHINEDESTVRRALIYLERQKTANVESIIHDGTRRWFEIDPTVDRLPPSTTEIAEKVDDNDLEFVSGAELGWEPNE